MKLKTRQTVLRLLKGAGYSIESSHSTRKWPNLLSIYMDINRSKIRGFGKAREALKDCPIDELIEVGLSWSDRSINRRYPPATLLSVEDALKGKPGRFLFGCVSCTYDVGPTTELSIYHVNRKL